jgi:branched-chain amino acid transport system ATP-binding protein
VPFGRDLCTRSLRKCFGSHAAVDGVDITVRARTLHAIIGPNGAGKTTLFNLLSGEATPTTGSVMFGDDDITRLDATARCHLGIGRSFQRTNVFPQATVFENVRLAVQAKTKKSYEFWRPAGAMSDVNERAEAVLTEAGLLEHRALPARELAGGDGRLLELAVTLAGAPEVLLLDEPSQGLSPEDARRLIDKIDALSERYTIVLIEHNMPLVMGLSDEITVMNFGTVLAHGTPAEIRDNGEVRTAYLGTRH